MKLLNNKMMEERIQTQLYNWALFHRMRATVLIRGKKKNPYTHLGNLEKDIGWPLQLEYSLVVGHYLCYPWRDILDQKIWQSQRFILFPVYGFSKKTEYVTESQVCRGCLVHLVIGSVKLSWVHFLCFISPRRFYFYFHVVYNFVSLVCFIAECIWDSSVLFINSSFHFTEG